MEVDGHCLCGDVTWRAKIDPDRVGICHCTDCQINSATAFRIAVMVPADDFELLSGELKVYVKTAESGNRRALSFCPRCGTSIHGGDVGESPFYSLRLGNCRQRHELRPRTQIWCRSALPWVDDVGDVRKFETQGRPPR
ncbi:MAG: GFA family protein [Minwuia sp.]|uniref:GFA family protein n=1 Tax=Minwuia sp. TaxID=2493630 RepID=UPI003A8A2D76